MIETISRKCAKLENKTKLFFYLPLDKSNENINNEYFCYIFFKYKIIKEINRLTFNSH